MKNIKGIVRLLMICGLIIQTKSVKEINRSEYMTNDSLFMISALNILERKDLINKEKQICIEILALYYEKNLANEIINQLGGNINMEEENEGEKIRVNEGNKVFINLFCKNYPKLVKRVKNLTGEFNQNGYKLLKSKWEKYSEEGEKDRKVKVILIINCLGEDRCCNILFNIIYKLVASNGGVEEMKLITTISTTVISYIECLKEKDIQRMDKDVRELYEKYKSEILQVSSIDHVEIGQTFLDIFLDCFSNLFGKYSHVISNLRTNYIVLRPEYVSMLSNLFFNPMRLPMITKPKPWGENKTGGYIYDVYNSLINSKGLVQQGWKNKKASEVSQLQYNAVNYLNSQKFEVNKDTGITWIWLKQK